MKPLVIIAGPTAVGKTKLSVMLAQNIGGEIISADSMQVYRHMDIGSAKIMPDEMQGIVHYGIDILEPEDEYNVCKFQAMAKDAVSQIIQNGNIPIIAGGTGFYIQSVLYDIDFTKEKNTKIRQKLEELAVQKGAEYLHEELRKVDPVSADVIHANNVKRVIRALEFYHLNHAPISRHNETEREKSAAYNNAFFVLTQNRQILYERIDKRVDLMVEQGLVQEVAKLKDMGLSRNNISMQGLGYKEILDYLDDIISLEEAIYRIKRDTRHFAKRQLTWFKREKDIIWVDRDNFKDDENKMLSYMMDKIQERGIVK
ncbi:MAG: tRNA (adenosine(37)-N6)-dimethylallyltransferase MiaA [Lachnospiraceae bacterium]|nr:tRNA (adenosine(37)-N6)-dimethylallyltransferase MiaA [Lachnospiraceae bacterium]